MSRRLSNFIYYPKSRNASVDGQEHHLSLKDMEEALYDAIVKANAVPDVGDLIGYEDDTSDAVIQQPLVTIIEDSSDVKPVIIGHGRGDGALPRNQAIYGLRNGQVVPGIYIPISFFGEVDQYACLC
jgi:hypothetical protein